jgi:hypothetical protein
MLFRIMLFFFALYKRFSRIGEAIPARPMVHLRSRDLRTTGRANKIRYVRGIGECAYVGKCIPLLSTKIAVIYRIKVI